MSMQKDIDRARAWALANPERRRAIALKSYLKHSPALKPTETPVERFERLSMPEPNTGCTLWLGASNKDGYGKIKVDRQHLTAHRWAWTLFRGAIPDGVHVLHRCDTPTCVNPAHLWLGTNSDNVRDREDKGRGAVLAIQRNPKLTLEAVVEIRNRHGIERVIDLAARFDVHHSVISRIQNHKSWTHV